MKTTIEFLEDVHVYLNSDGVIIPSVSELIRFRYPEAYKDIPSKILQKKAQYGTKVHDLIEKFVKGEFTLDDLKNGLNPITGKRLDPSIRISIEQFEELRKKWCFQIKDMEQIVSYKGKYAGMFDLRTIDDVIIDIKTTAELHEDWLALQLGLYQLAAGIESDVAYCMWLPKGKAGKVVAIKPWSHEECKRLLKEYEEHTPEQ